VKSSVVIPAHDAEATIGRAVAALAGHDVVVVDDGSRDGTGDKARAAGARVVRLETKGGPARARNAGVRAAESDVVVFTDADCEPLPGFVEALVAPLEKDATLTGTKGAYVTEQRGLTARFVQLEYEERYARMARRREIDFVDTYACAYRRSALLEAGGFDERYDRPSTEDQELSFRLHERGARFVFVPEARTRHRHADSPGAYLAKKAKIGTFKVATLRAHPSKAIDDAHTPLLLKVQLLLAPLAVAGLAVAGLALEDRRWLAALALPLAFLLTTLPLAARALASDPVLAPLVPIFALGRAVALGFGVARGLVRSPLAPSPTAEGSRA
jgi:cellulose synthase/poly-beta-1,6-N-acetylglucosamine synthase-like glycosyltransferase